MRYSDVVWDFNGTIINDVEASISSVNDMLIKRGRQKTDLLEYYEKIEMPIVRYYEKMFDLSEDPLEILVKEYQEGYKRHFSEITLSDSIVETLSELQKRGVRQIILSSFKTEKIESLCEKFSIRQYFDEILGADNNRAESKIERGKSFANSLQDKKRAVAVGDLLHDWETAEAMGIDCILYSKGHQAKKDLLTSGVYVADSIKEVLNRILL